MLTYDSAPRLQNPHTGLATFCHRAGGTVVTRGTRTMLVFVFPQKCAQTNARARTKSSLGEIFPLTTITATEAESQSTGLLNIGHVFFPRNQSQIPDMQSASTVEVGTVQLKWTWQLSVLQMLSR